MLTPLLLLCANNNNNLIPSSWGEYWGDSGFAKIKRGGNDLLLESSCFWVHPSGWGVPSDAWEEYSSEDISAATKTLIAEVVLADKARSGAMEGSPVPVVATGGKALISVMLLGAAVALLFFLVRRDKGQPQKGDKAATQVKVPAVTLPSAVPQWRMKNGYEPVL